MSDASWFRGRNPSDVSRIADLYRKHIGGGDVVLVKLHDVLRREVRAAEEGRIRVSPSLLTELRGERNFIGRMVGRKD